MEKLENKHIEAVSVLAIILTTDKLLSMLEEDVIPDLPKVFNKTKLKFIELIEQFKEDTDSAMPNYLKEEKGE